MKLVVFVILFVAVASATDVEREQDWEEPTFIETDPQANQAVTPPPPKAVNAKPTSGLPNTAKNRGARSKDNLRSLPPFMKRGPANPNLQQPAWTFERTDPAYRSTYFTHPWLHPAFGPPPVRWYNPGPSPGYQFSNGMAPVPYRYVPYQPSYATPAQAAGYSSYSAFGSGGFPYLAGYPSAAQYVPRTGANNYLGGYAGADPASYTEHMAPALD